MDVRTLQTPVGLLKLTATDTALTGVWLNATGTPNKTRASGVLAETEQQLKAYFAGTLETFDLPLALTGTPFQCEVWTMLRYIPFGETCSYAELADRIGRPNAMRAVGAANGQNPIPIVIPCHRVIGANGSLTGFGGGLKMKAWLLRHEDPQGALWR
ncbi:MAG: methylated-DNA--[protein]-cysteine S-methyltransferase [Acidobacteriota bacterium]